MPGPLDYKRYKHGCDPHDIPMKHYFDISAGIRGSDRGHEAAIEYHKRISPLLETPAGTLQVAKEGFEIAEQTRQELAWQLGCEPRNIFFGNSATRALIPIFLSLGRRESYKLIASELEFSALQRLVVGGQESLEETITRQNYGELGDNKNLRNFDDIGRLSEFRAKMGIQFITSLKLQGQFGKVKDEGLQILYFSHTDRSSGIVAAKIYNTNALGLGEGEVILIVDASHTIGARGFRALNLGDIVIMNSSKTLGGEPTIGICYVNDKALSILEKELPKTEWPRIAFQFSPETLLGIRSATDATACTNWISLPELFSLNSVFDNLDIREKIERMEKLEFYIRGAITVLHANCKSISFHDTSMNRTPNIVHFVLVPKKGYDPSERFIQLLQPYVINYETFFANTISPEAGVCGPMGLGNEENRNVHRFRISWSAEHTLEYAGGLCRKIADALDEVYSKQTRKSLESYERIFLMHSKREAIAAIDSETDRSVKVAIAAFHPDFIVRKVTQEKIKDTLNKEESDAIRMGELRVVAGI